ncbi:MAG: hypothetical protein ACJA0Y_000996 [Maricaulis maris]|jgi:hypothetical protein
MDRPKNYLEIDGNKVIAPTAERQAELDAANGESEDVFSFTTPAQANEGVRLAVIILAVHAAYRVLITISVANQMVAAQLSFGSLSMMQIVGLAVGSVVGVFLSGGLAYAIFRHSRAATVLAIHWGLFLSIAPINAMFDGRLLSAILPLLFNAALLFSLIRAAWANFAWHRFQRGELANPEIFD